MNSHQLLLLIFYTAIAIVLSDNEFEPSKNSKQQIEGRFLPFSASFTLNAGHPSNSHSVALGASKDGISLSQSSSLSSGGTGSLSASQSSSFAAGLSGVSASDANSFNLNHPLLGTNSRTDSNSFSIGQAASAANAIVQNNNAISNAQSSIGSTHSLASSGVHSNPAFQNNQGLYNDKGLLIHNQNYDQTKPNWNNFGPGLEIYDYPGSNRRPSLSVNENWNPTFSNGGSSVTPIEFGVVREDSRGNKRKPDFNGYPWQSHNRPSYQNGWGWYADDCRPGQRCRNNRGTTGWFSPSLPSDNVWSQGNSGSQWQQHQSPDLQVNTASASASSSSSGTNGLSISQSSSHSNSGSRGPTSSTINKVQTLGNAQGHAQGAATSIELEKYGGKTDGSFSSGSVSGISNGHGQSFGSSFSKNQGEGATAQINAQGVGGGSALGTANSGDLSLTNIFSKGQSHPQNIHQEFIGSSTKVGNQRNNQHPLDTIISDIEDTVVDLLVFPSS